jgi:hypothetical protein
MTNANGVYETRVVVVEGREYRVEFCFDDDMRAPDEEHEESHGPMLTRDDDFQAATIDELCEAYGDDDAMEEYLIRQHSVWIAKAGTDMSVYYDVWSALRRAAAENWGPNPIEAVSKDLEYIRGWYTDKWHWCAIVVTDTVTGNFESLYGNESDATSYHEEVISELIAELRKDCPA